MAVCVQAAASPMPPTVQAALSANGRVLCYVEMKEHSDNGGVSYHLESVTYHIYTFTEARGPSSYIGTLVPATNGRFWTNFAEDWSITLTGSGSLKWPIVSDDGATLALLSYDLPMEHSPLLEVYHRDRDKARSPSRVGSYTLDDLWTPDEIKSVENRIVINQTDMWYSSGVFTFPSSSELEYTNRWHDITRINLVTGELTHAKKR
jgi:hypothetical protein